jgi:hypothetical protein
MQILSTLILSTSDKTMHHKGRDDRYGRFPIPAHVAEFIFYSHHEGIHIMQFKYLKDEDEFLDGGKGFYWKMPKGYIQYKIKQWELANPTSARSVACAGSFVVSSLQDK